MRTNRRLLRRKKVLRDARNALRRYARALRVGSELSANLNCGEFLGLRSASYSAALITDIDYIRMANRFDRITKATISRRSFSGRLHYRACTS